MFHFRTLVFVLLFGTSLFVFGQDTTSIKNKYFHVSYFGNNITRPGISVGYQQQLFQKEIVKVKKNNKSKTKLKSLSIIESFAFYNHKNSYSASILNIGFEFIKTTPNKWIYGTNLSPGIFISFLPNTYFIENNSVYHKKITTQYFLNLKTSFVFGKKINRFNYLNYWFIKPSSIFLIKYNYTPVIPLFNLEFGVNFNLCK